VARGFHLNLNHHTAGCVHTHLLNLVGSKVSIYLGRGTSVVLNLVGSIYITAMKHECIHCTIVYETHIYQ
jgi:hypothetical protein